MTIMSALCVGPLFAPECFNKQILTTNAITCIILDTAAFLLPLSVASHTKKQSRKQPMVSTQLSLTPQCQPACTSDRGSVSATIARCSSGIGLSSETVVLLRRELYLRLRLSAQVDFGVCVSTCKWQSKTRVFSAMNCHGLPFEPKTRHFRQQAQTNLRHLENPQIGQMKIVLIPGPNKGAKTWSQDIVSSPRTVRASGRGSVGASIARRSSGFCLSFANLESPIPGPRR